MSYLLMILFGLFMLSAPASAADQQDTRVCLFFQAGRSQEENRIRSILVTQLSLELEARGFTIVPEEEWRAAAAQVGLSPSSTPESAAAVRVARKTGADAAITGSIQIRESEIILRIKGYSSSSQNLVIDYERRGPTDISIYNQVGSLVEDIIPALVGRAAAVTVEPAPSRPERPKEGVQTEAPAPEGSKTAEAEMPLPADNRAGLVRLTLRSPDEGAQILVEPIRQGGLIEYGKLVVEVPANSRLTIEKRKSGYHPDRESVELTPSMTEVQLRPLSRSSRFGLELVYTSSQFLGLGAGFRLYVLPDYLLLRTEDYLYFTLGSFGIDVPSAFHNDFNLQFGSYLFTPPRWRVRIGVSTGLGMILSIIDSSAFLDFYWEAFDLWLDLNFSRWAVFFKVEGKYSLGAAKGVLERGFLTDYGPQYTIGWLMKW